MKIILTEDVIGLGDIGQTVAVRPGYARNFLIPRGLGFEVSTVSARAMAHKMRGIDARKKQLKSVAEQQAQAVRDIAIEMGLRVSGSGRVFGSVGARDIVEVLNAQLVKNGESFQVDRRRILIDEPIKKVGTHFVRVKVHAELDAQLKVVVNAISATKEEEEAEVQKVKAVLEEKSDE